MSTKKHNMLVDKVKEQLIDKGYDEIVLHTDYSLGVSGEIDIYARKPGYICCFEIKCNYTKKA
jgi:Holliday junction resolvase-like predicted endonuclease